MNERLTDEQIDESLKHVEQWIKFYSQGDGFLITDEFFTEIQRILLDLRYYKQRVTELEQIANRPDIVSRQRHDELLKDVFAELGKEQTPCHGNKSTMQIIGD